MQHQLSAAKLAASLAAAPAAKTVDFDVHITNLSNAIYYTPFLASDLNGQHRFDNPVAQVRIE